MQIFNFVNIFWLFRTWIDLGSQAHWARLWQGLTQGGNVPFTLGFTFYLAVLKPNFFSFDIDVLDPSEAPATGTRVRGGLTLRSIIKWQSFDRFWIWCMMPVKFQGGSSAGPLGELHRTSFCCGYGWGSLFHQQTFSVLSYLPLGWQLPLIKVNPRLARDAGDAERTVEAAGSILLAALGLRKQPPL